MFSVGIKLDRESIAELCRVYHVKKLSIFGSALRADFKDESDVDVLVEFEPGRTPGFAFFELQERLSEALGRKVDLNTPGFLSRYFRDQVLAGAEVLYDKG